jgi:hypothetical protein
VNPKGSCVGLGFDLEVPRLAPVRLRDQYGLLRRQHAERIIGATLIQSIGRGSVQRVASAGLESLRKIHILAPRPRALRELRTQRKPEALIALRLNPRGDLHGGLRGGIHDQKPRIALRGFATPAHALTIGLRALRFEQA